MLGLLRALRVAVGAARERFGLARARTRMRKLPPGSVASLLCYRIKITDGLNFYLQYKDEFIRRIYHFEAVRPDPLIIDGGSNMGMSILAFKRAYPRARIIGFEPDPQIFALLRENLARNGVTDVKLVQAALGTRAGVANFQADGSAGGSLTQDPKAGFAVRVEPLTDYLAEPVDFLKLNVEGQELPVLRAAAASGQLRNVREMVLEYHGWPHGEQSLGDILNILDKQGFRYQVHDFDSETCGASKPPFHLGPETTWFCLVYARRTDSSSGQ